MSLRAWAFHEAISFDRLEELFQSDANALFSGTLAGKCAKCGLRFGIFFPAKDDPQNGEYMVHLQEMIEADCREGAHRGEYIFSTTP